MSKLTYVAGTDMFVDEEGKFHPAGHTKDKPSIRKSYHGLPLWFGGSIYRFWSKFIHKHGYHYAPREYPIEGTEVHYGLDRKPIREWRHWCKWCGLRGNTHEF